jgi:membrane-bound inhibitor of C-type lysozyme
MRYWEWSFTCAFASITLVACADDLPDDTAAAATTIEDTTMAPPPAPPVNLPAGGAVAAAAQAFDCGELRFNVRIDNSIARIDLPDRSIQLPLSTTSSGRRYTDGQSTFWEESGRAHLELPEASYHDCEAAAPADTLPR